MCWLGINRAGVAIVVVRPGKLLYSHSFGWDSSMGAVGTHARLLQRYTLVASLAPEVRRAVAAAREQGTTVDGIVTCGNLPDLRSLTMPLIEELDLEVETLDSLDGIMPRAADRGSAGRHGAGDPDSRGRGSRARHADHRRGPTAAGSRHYSCRGNTSRRRRRRRVGRDRLRLVCAVAPSRAVAKAACGGHVQANGATRHPRSPGHGGGSASPPAGHTFRGGSTCQLPRQSHGDASSASVTPGPDTRTIPAVVRPKPA